MFAIRKLGIQSLRFYSHRYALLAGLLLFVGAGSVSGEPPISVFDDEVFAEPFADSEFADCESCEPGFDNWDEGIDTGEMLYEQRGFSHGRHRKADLRPFDWVRHFGFRHSSTHGRHVDRGLPLEGTSWLNRPFHVDWFSGPLLGDDLVDKQVAQDNELFGGFRVGWDIDYYWGLEARFGWSKPNVQFSEQQQLPDNGSYFISDVDVVYYPWGDSKVRPYMLFGAGMARVRFSDTNSNNFNTTLFTTPFGGGLQIMQTPSLIWRFEVLDNLSYGADGVETMHNVSLTAGMELRIGSRPQSYWPWRASRKYW
ncbi:MAG: hypothetical protein AAGD11_07540 [Planctomycetota bacterium]